MKIAPSCCYFTSIVLVSVVSSCIVGSVRGFSCDHLSSGERRTATATRLLLSSLPQSNPQEQTLDNYLPTDHPLHALITATIQACSPRKLDTTEDAHEAFRYEWGTWCATEKLDSVMETLNSVRLYTGVYEDLLDGTIKTTIVGEEDGSESYVASDGNNNEGEQLTGKKMGKRIRVAGGKYWDILLHVMPKGA